MERRIDFNFSHVFEGVIWNTIISPEAGILIVEARDSDKKIASFSALDASSGEFLWRNIVFDEPWWISLSAASRDIVLFTVYLETNNPDRKGVFAYDLHDQKVVWWNNDFSLSSLSSGMVSGVSSKYGPRDLVLDLASGKEVSGEADAPKVEDEVIRPVQYLADNDYFATVKTFLDRRFNLIPVIALEYLEYDSIIFISFYTQEGELANYLLIVSAEGRVMMKEKLLDHLKGIGMDTFFILSGCVFFVKNKMELFSYKIV